MNEDRGSRIVRSAIHTLVKCQSKLFKRLALGEAKRIALRIKVKNLEEQAREKERNYQRDLFNWTEFALQNEEEVGRLRTELEAKDAQLTQIPWVCRALICQNAKKWGLESAQVSSYEPQSEFLCDLDDEDDDVIIIDNPTNRFSTGPTKSPSFIEVNNLLFATQQCPDLSHPWEQQHRPIRASTPYPHGTNPWIRDLPASPIVHVYSPPDYSQTWANRNKDLDTPECPCSQDNCYFEKETQKIVQEYLPNYSLQSETVRMDVPTSTVHAPTETATSFYVDIPNSPPHRATDIDSPEYIPTHATNQSILNSPKYNQFTDETTGEILQEWFPNPNLTTNSLQTEPIANPNCDQTSDQGAPAR
jgi:hypothetical protein